MGDPIYLIVNADDLGYDPAIDRGILRAAREGIVTSTTAMVNMPFIEEALEAAEALPRLGIGLHLNFARGPALAGPSSLSDAAASLDEARAARADAGDAEREANAQLQRFIQLAGRPPTHIDVHKHLHRHPAIFEGVFALAKKEGIPMRVLDSRMDARVKGALPSAGPFLGDTGDVPYWTLPTLLRTLDSLGEGVHELMCHPGYPPERTRTGYGAQRAVELESFCHPQARAAVERRGIALVDFGSLGVWLGATPASVRR